MSASITTAPQPSPHVGHGFADPEPRHHQPPAAPTVSNGYYVSSPMPPFLFPGQTIAAGYVQPTATQTMYSPVHVPMVVTAAPDMPPPIATLNKKSTEVAKDVDDSKDDVGRAMFKKTDAKPNTGANTILQSLKKASIDKKSIKKKREKLEDMNPEQLRMLYAQLKQKLSSIDDALKQRTVDSEPKEVDCPEQKTTSGPPGAGSSAARQHTPSAPELSEHTPTKPEEAATEEAATEGQIGKSTADSGQTTSERKAGSGQTTSERKGDSGQTTSQDSPNEKQTSSPSHNNPATSNSKGGLSNAVV